MMTYERILKEVDSELTTAVQHYRSLGSHHEAYSVILEELDEYWEEVKLRSEKRDPAKLRKELIQTAAMCIRAIHDVCERK